MPALSINIDHFASLREIRNRVEPEPVTVAALAELGGANSITCHLRPDKMHIQERDIRVLRQTIKTKLNLQVAPSTDMIQFAMDILPDYLTLVSEKSDNIITETGLNIAIAEREIAEIVETLKRNNVTVIPFIDPDIKQVKAVRRTGATAVEINTGYLSNSVGEKQSEEYYRLKDAVIAANKFGLAVRVGSHLNYNNAKLVAQLEHVKELIIGHAIVSRSCLVGVKEAVQDMIKIID